MPAVEAADTQALIGRHGRFTYAELDREVRRATADEASLDDVARGLTAHGGPVDLATLRQVTQKVTGAPSSVLADDRVPGY